MSSGNVITEITGKISPDGPHEPEAGRYILYVQLGCPFAIRPTIVRELKGLQDSIELCILDYHYQEIGKDSEGNPEWGLGFCKDGSLPLTNPDPVMNADTMKEIYHKFCPAYKGRYTIPVLFDKKRNEIVSNDSGELMRILNFDFNNIAKNKNLDLFPEDKEPLFNDSIKWALNSFFFLPIEAMKAKSQEEYEKIAKEFEKQLLELDQRLGKGKYYFGDQLTVVDVSLLLPIIRSDMWNPLMCRINHIYVKDQLNIMRWIKDILSLDGIKHLMNLEHIKGLSYSKPLYNPSRIIPLGNSFELPE